MSQTSKKSGSCLCGAVSFEAATASSHVGACHCGMCQKWAAGPLLTVDCGTEVSFTGEEHISSYASSAWAERSFCSKCGAPLFYKLKETGQFIMSACLLDEKGDLTFEHQIYIDKKPSFYSFAEETKKMTEAEFLAQFANT